MKIHQMTYVSNKKNKRWRAEIIFDCDVSYKTVKNVVNVTFEYSTYKGNFSYTASINDFTISPNKDTLIYLMQYDPHFVEGIVFGIQYVMFQYSKSSNPPIILNIKIMEYSIRTITRNQNLAFCMIQGLYRALKFSPKIQPETRRILGELGEEYVHIFPNVPYPPPVGIHTNLTYEIMDNVSEKEFWIQKYYKEQEEYYKNYCPNIET